MTADQSGRGNSPADDHERDMQDPEYRRAYEAATKELQACPIPTPPGYEPCWKGRGHSGLHDFRRLDDPKPRQEKP